MLVNIGFPTPEYKEELGLRAQCLSYSCFCPLLDPLTYNACPDRPHAAGGFSHRSAESSYQSESLAQGYAVPC